MTVIEAALKVLQEAATPLHYHEITKRVLAVGHWKTEGKTPDATLVGLMNGKQLVALLVENEIGVRRTPLQLIELGKHLRNGGQEVME